MLIQRLFAYLAPYDCLQCGTEGALVCINCFSRLAHVSERCYRCRKPSLGGRTCSGCTALTGVSNVYVRARYNGIAKQLVHELKFNSARDAANEIAWQLAPLLPSDNNVLLVPVPTATSRARQRGYDQAQLLAKALARAAGQPYVPALGRLGQQRQVGASREMRRLQLHDAYWCVRPQQIRHQHVVLVDDVMTTGASLESAARTLLLAGARQVSAVVFARA